jgi:ATP-dependent DNA helicase DinG
VSRRDRPLKAPDAPAIPDVPELLTAAVAGIGGAERPGQVAMALAVRDAIDSGTHLAVQAGTGTGKSLAYLVPAIRHALLDDDTVVVATATIALQRQLIDRDLPRLAEALKPVLRREPRFAILKGRRNYLCLNRQLGGIADDDSDTLFDPSDTISPLGRQVKRLHEWAGETQTGDRDELVPGVPEAAWRQVSVSAQECIGAQRCSYGTQCFAEKAREAAGRAHVVVTNHALLAIDATSEIDVLPEHDVVIIDEAHDLVDRVTSAVTGELSGPAVEAAARRAGRLIAGAAGTAGTAGTGTATGTDTGTDIASDNAAAADGLRKAASALAIDLDTAPEGRMDILPDTLAATLVSVAEAAGTCAEAVRAVSKRMEEDPARLAACRIALATLDDLHTTAVRIAETFDEELTARGDVVWLDRPPADDNRRAATLRVAPLEVGGLLRDRLFRERVVALTSATLVLGGSFTPLAIQWGLPADGKADKHDNSKNAGNKNAGNKNAGNKNAGNKNAGNKNADKNANGNDSADSDDTPWTALDVGSPFDHPRSGILYVARQLPPPGRDGLQDAYLDEIAELIDAAGGRTLGLFSSMRAAVQAAEALRDRIGYPLLCQGDDVTAQLVKEFAADEKTCLFGTLSLWQGVDVPGSSLQLVIIDRIPFPRPDDPLASARQRAVAARGGNGFMSVAASQAALLLAQGAGRLLRTMSDRGVVAVLDPRLVTARYGDFLRKSLPPFWTTTDPALVRAALRRLRDASPR